MLRAVNWVARNKWRLAALTAAGGTAYMVWRSLRHLPLKEILALAREHANSEIDETIRGGDGSRIVMVCIEDLRAELTRLQNVSEKQARLKDLASRPLAERLPAYQELSIASFARTVSAVYALSMVQLFVNTQVFELIRHQRGGRPLFEDAQRRFLSVVRGFAGGEGGGGGLGELVGRVEEAVRCFFKDRRQSEVCDAVWMQDSLAQLRDAVEGPVGAGGGRPLQAEMTRALLALLQARLPEDGGVGDVQMGMRGALDPGVQERMLLARMCEVVQSELYAEAFAGLLERFFEILQGEIMMRGLGVHEGGGGGGQAAGALPRPASLPLVKLVPIVANVFSVVLGQGGLQQGPFHAQAAEVEECRNLFQAVGVGGG